jgi:TPR repeat protein
LEIGEAEKGFAELKAAEELGRSPQTAEEARTAANYYGDAQNWEKSVFWYKIAITKDPSDNEARLKLGLVYYMSGRRELAKEEIARVMQKTDLKKSPAYELLLPILRDLGLNP